MSNVRFQRGTNIPTSISAIVYCIDFATIHTQGMKKLTVFTDYTEEFAPQTQVSAYTNSV